MILTEEPRIYFLSQNDEIMNEQASPIKFPTITSYPIRFYSYFMTASHETVKEGQIKVDHATLKLRHFIIY